MDNHVSHSKFRGGLGMLLRNIIATTAFVALSSSAPQIADANTTTWHQTALTCTPSGATIANHLIQESGGWVAFDGILTGTIVVRCPVPADVGGFVQYLQLFGVDPTVGSNDSYIGASLRRISKSTSATTVIAGVNSSSSTFSAYHQYTSTFTSHTFDHANYWYFVEIFVIRNASGGAPNVIGVELQY